MLYELAMAVGTTAVIVVFIVACVVYIDKGNTWP